MSCEVFSEAVGSVSADTGVCPIVVVDQLCGGYAHGCHDVAYGHSGVQAEGDECCAQHVGSHWEIEAARIRYLVAHGVKAVIPHALSLLHKDWSALAATDAVLQDVDGRCGQRDVVYVSFFAVG